MQNTLSDIYMFVCPAAFCFYETSNRINRMILYLSPFLKLSSSIRNNSCSYKPDAPHFSQVIQILKVLIQKSEFDQRKLLIRDEKLN